MKKYKKRTYKPEKGETVAHEKGESAAFEKKEKDRKYRKPKLGTGTRFKQLKGKLAAKGAKNPGALAAYIGRKKYGAKKMASLASKGKKKRSAGVQAGSRNPFGNLGKNENMGVKRFAPMRNQGQRMSGADIIKKATAGLKAAYRR